MHALTCSGGIFDFAVKQDRLKEVELELAEPSVWDDPEKAQALGRERASLEAVVSTIEVLDAGCNDASDLLDLAVEEDDEDTAQSVEQDLTGLESELEKLEFRRMFSGETDPNNAYLDIQAGSGGTEAQDWAEMLLRMYLRWGEDKGFKTTLVEASAGEVAGLKSATIQFEGEYAFGWLRTETGVHRLVRKSPFDSGGRRHTSFASIFVSPEIDDNIEIEINPADLRIDTYRSSGAGGQHVNTTDSAVRITHIPTGTVVSQQDEKSQHKNRAKAMTILRSRLYEAERERQANERAEDRRSQVGSGDRSERVRTYNFPQGRVTDHRINLTLYKIDQIITGPGLAEVIDALVEEDQASRLADMD